MTWQICKKNDGLSLSIVTMGKVVSPRKTWVTLEESLGERVIMLLEKRLEYYFPILTAIY